MHDANPRKPRRCTSCEGLAEASADCWVCGEPVCLDCVTNLPDPAYEECCPICLRLYEEELESGRRRP